jgi:hypothetical protein
VEISDIAHLYPWGVFYETFVYLSLHPAFNIVACGRVLMPGLNAGKNERAKVLNR